MDGRNRIPPPNALQFREIPLTRVPHPTLIEDPRHHRLPLPMSAAAAVAAAAGRPHQALIEERMVAQHREMQSLLLDNQQLGATHVALKQELVAANKELHHISGAAAKVKAERDAQIREVYERSLKLDAEVRSIDALNGELTQVRTDVQKLSAVRAELTSQLQAIKGDLSRTRAELQQAGTIKTEIENMHQEIQRGRTAIEYEKKVHAENLEHSQTMEKSMIALAREVEKLRAELGNAEKRARAAAAAAAAANPGPGYIGSYGNTEMGYGGNSYVMHQVSGSASSQYGSGAVSNGPFDMPQTYAHRKVV